MEYQVNIFNDSSFTERNCTPSVDDTSLEVYTHEFTTDIRGHYLEKDASITNEIDLAEHHESDTASVAAAASSQTPIIIGMWVLVRQKTEDPDSLRSCGKILSIRRNEAETYEAAFFAIPDN